MDLINFNDNDNKYEYGTAQVVTISELDVLSYGLHSSVDALTNDLNSFVQKTNLEINDAFTEMSYMDDRLSEEIDNHTVRINFLIGSMIFMLILVCFSFFFMTSNYERRISDLEDQISSQNEQIVYIERELEK